MKTAMMFTTAMVMIAIVLAPEAGGAGLGACQVKVDAPIIEGNYVVARGYNRCTRSATYEELRVAIYRQRPNGSWQRVRRGLKVAGVGALTITSRKRCTLGYPGLRGWRARAYAGALVRGVIYHGRQTKSALLPC